MLPRHVQIPHLLRPAYRTLTGCFLAEGWAFHFSPPLIYKMNIFLRTCEVLKKFKMAAAVSELQDSNPGCSTEMVQKSRSDLCFQKVLKEILRPGSFRHHPYASKAGLRTWLLQTLQAHSDHRHARLKNLVENKFIVTLHTNTANFSSTWFTAPDLQVRPVLNPAEAIPRGLSPLFS